MLIEEMLKLAVPFSVIGIGELIRLGSTAQFPSKEKNNDQRENESEREKENSYIYRKDDN